MTHRKTHVSWLVS